jgi:hypothetical protein
MVQDLKKVNIVSQYVLLGLFFFGAIGNYFSGDSASLIVCLISPIIVFLPQIFRFVKIPTPQTYEFIYLLIVAMFLFVGDTLGVYLSNYWYDKTNHLITGILFYLLGMSIIYRRFGREHLKQHFWKLAIYSFFFALLLESIWESLELIIDLTFGTNMMQDGLRDTSFDIAMTIIGSLIATLLIHINLFIRKIWYIDEFIKELIKEKHQEEKQHIEI